MYHPQYIRIPRTRKENRLNKKKQEQVYWVALAGMIIVLIGSIFVKSNVIQIVGLLVVVGAFVYLWRMSKKKAPEIKK